jgi:uncharacterized membrane protein
MESGQDWRLLFPPALRRLPADLVAVLLWLAATNLAVFLPVVRETPLRIALGLPLLLFLPGYALVAALFPEAATERPAAELGEDENGGRTHDGIDGIERVALSFGVSIAVVPLLGLVLNFTPFGIRLTPIMVAVSGFTLLATAVAAQRRQELGPEERFAVPYRSWLAQARTELFAPDSRTDAALNVLLVASVLLAVGSVGYAVAVPKQGEAFTELYLLTEDDGELVADDYPTEFTRGEPQSLVVGVGNHEHERVSYTLLVELHRVETANNSTRVLDRERLQQFEPSLADNETWHRPHSVEPTMTGQRLRLTYLLYRGNAPANPTVESAYRETHLWINVSAS